MDSDHGLVLFHSTQIYLTLFCFTKSVLNGSSEKTVLFGRKISVSFMQNMLVQIVACSMKSLVCDVGEAKLLWNAGTEDVPFSFPFCHVEAWLDQQQKESLELKIIECWGKYLGKLSYTLVLVLLHSYVCLWPWMETGQLDR